MINKSHMSVTFSEFDWIDSLCIKSSRGVRLPIFHLILFFDKTGTLFISQLWVRPTAIWVTTLTEACLRLKGVVYEVIGNFIVELCCVDTLEEVFFLLYRLGGRFQLLGVLRSFTRTSSHWSATFNAIHRLSSLSLLGLSASSIRCLTVSSLTLWSGECCFLFALFFLRFAAAAIIIFLLLLLLWCFEGF